MATDRSEPYTCLTSGTDLSSLLKPNLTGESKHSSKHLSRFMLRTKVPKRAKQTSLFCRTTTFPHKRVSFGCSIGSAVAVERITIYYHLRSMRRRSRARMRLLLTVQHAIVYQLLIGSWSRSAELHTAQDGTKFRHKAQVIFHNPPQAGC